MLTIDLEKLEIPNGSVILDLGCGTGIVTRSLSSVFKYVYGIDYSANMLQKAKEKIPQTKEPE